MASRDDAEASANEMDGALDGRSESPLDSAGSDETLFSAS